MSSKPLANRKVAVLVESQYIPIEMNTYREKFAEYGATVDFVSYLWKQPKLTFVGEVEEPGQTPETMEVTKDIGSVKVEDYAAVIMSANYTSVRLRQFETPEGQQISANMVRNAPAVKFFARAMRNPDIVKGVLCHGLWILTPMPELLAGRRVICHEVVLADVVNAGAIYTPSPTGVVIDGDLVTGRSYHETAAMAEAIKDRILATEERRERPRPQPDPVGTQQPGKTGKRRILVALSEWGFWGEELIGPLDEFDKAGYSVDFVTPTGKRPVAIGVSKDADFFDPALKRPVTSPEVAAKTIEIDDPNTERGKRLDNPLNLSEWFPERPYWAAPNFVRAMEVYNRQRARAEESLRKYDALLIVGGSGPIVDLANNQRLHDVILGFLRVGKLVAAECYGVACLAFARDVEDRKSIIWGKRVTGHCIEYDYKDGTGFMRGRDDPLPFNMGPPPYPLEFILRDSTGPEGQYIGNFGEETSVIVDYPFVTGRSTPDSYLTGQKVIEVLETGLRRWGW